MKEKRWTLHLLLIALFAAGIGVLFLQEPGFGDDFTYWAFALRLHEHGLKAWYSDSFHDLRWPVWGICWLIQAFRGPGLLSYYGEPILYLMAGAALSFTFGRLIMRSLPASWACGIVFLFHPLLDTVNYRPMPDLSEGVWGGASVLCWWALMQARERNRSLLFAALTGACIFIGESNRITGVFIIPILILCTLLFFRRDRFWWLVAAGGFSASFYCAEAVFYHWRFHDWVHDVHANLGNKGHKGTDPVPLLRMPFRFVNSLWKGSHVAKISLILAIAGSIASWRRRRTHVAEDTPAEENIHTPEILAKVMSIWFVGLYFEYACFPQSVHPWRPLIRDADRFLCGLLVPLAVLCILALFWLLQMQRVRSWKAAQALIRYPLITGCAAVLFLVYTDWKTLGFFDLGYVPEMQRYMRSVPAGTKVFTHNSMRSFAFLVEPDAAAKINWVAEHEILWKVGYIEKEAGHCDQFWYARKLLWLGARKQLERKPDESAPELSSFIDTPEVKWKLAKLLAKAGDVPDFIFYRKRTPQDPPPVILGPDAAELGGIFPPLPAEWPGARQEQRKTATWQIPAELRGKVARVELDATAHDIETFGCWLRFAHGNFVDAVFALKPYLHEQHMKNFFAIEIPAGSDHCEIELKLAAKSKPVTFHGFRAIVE